MATSIESGLNADVKTVGQRRCSTCGNIQGLPSLEDQTTSLGGCRAVGTGKVGASLNNGVVDQGQNIIESQAVSLVFVNSRDTRNKQWEKLVGIGDRAGIYQIEAEVQG
jgi:hypothetical protein